VKGLLLAGNFGGDTHHWLAVFVDSPGDNIYLW
jgi:hypothetical protein